MNLRELADLCGVSATAVYRHYKSKEHLLSNLIEEILDELQNVMIKANDPKRFQKMGIAYVQFALQNPVRFRLTFENSINKNKFPSLLKKHLQTFSVVKTEIERCVNNGLMFGEVDTLTYTAWATVHGTAMLILDNQIIANNETHQIQIAHDISSIVGRGLVWTDDRKSAI